MVARLAIALGTVVGITACSLTPVDSNAFTCAVDADCPTALACDLDAGFAAGLDAGLCVASIRSVTSGSSSGVGSSTAGSSGVAASTSGVTSTSGALSSIASASSASASGGTGGTSASMSSGAVGATASSAAGSTTASPPTSSASGTSGSSSTGSSSTGGSSTGGVVVTVADAGYCTIDGTTYPPLAVNATNICLQCDPLHSSTNWTSHALGCGADGGGCTIDGVMVPPASGSYPTWSFLPPDGCQACVPSVSTSAWTPVADGKGCGAGTCKSGVCDCYGVGACVRNNFCDNIQDDANCGGCGNVCQDGMYCSQAGTCESPAQLTLARSDHAINTQAYLSGTILIAGGRNDGGPLADTTAYSTGVNKVASSGDDLPTARYGLALALSTNIGFYAAGGTLADGTLSNEVDFIPVDLVGAWQKVNPLATAVTGAAAAFQNGSSALPLVLAGGSNASGPTNQVQIWDGGASMNWSFAATPLPAACGDALAAEDEYGGDLVVCGSGSTGVTQWGEFYANAFPTWRNQRLGAAAATGIGSNGTGLFYIIGGLLPDGGFSDEVDIYNPFENAWSVGPPLPTPRAGLACTGDVATNRIYCFGGYNGQFLTTVDALMLSVGAWAHD